MTLYTAPDGKGTEGKEFLAVRAARDATQHATPVTSATPCSLILKYSSNCGVRTVGARLVETFQMGAIFETLFHAPEVLRSPMLAVFVEGARF